MHRVRVVTFVALLAVPAVAPGQARKQDKAVKDMGVQARGWTGRVDPQAARRGAKITDGALRDVDGALHATSGPPVIYWSPVSVGAGVYEAKATFSQTRSPGPGEYYGLFIGGSKLDKPQQNYLSCAISGNGTFVVKHRLGDEVHDLAGRTAHAAIKRSDAAGKASNELAWRVTADRTSCVVNGTEVWGYASASLVGEGKLESLDGFAGIRLDANLDVHVAGFAVGTR